MAKVDSNISNLVVRISNLIKKNQPDSTALRTALIRIGAVVSSQAKINIRRHGLIDTGRLINSVSYQMFNQGGKQGVKVGSFGVPYAAVHEFGFQGTVTVRTHQRLMAKVFGKPVAPRRISIGQHQRFMRIPKRPYLRPAVRRNQDFIIDTIREALGVAST